MLTTLGSLLFLIVVYNFLVVRVGLLGQQQRATYVVGFYRPDEPLCGPMLAIALTEVCFRALKA
jgi:hypothetical protein